ncbi:MetQ/NlpA family ABC transporter substrate-binding protein [Pseudomonas sp. NA-150]|uniref:MetQ/NlpA family ABC transporter substrate-binding protein n=1 Tax=Pseudomonas sp. NA-150 TaxID=3367525 RepID=UPI0037C5C71A
MKKLLAAFAAVVALTVHADETLTVGASATPQAEILEVVKPLLAKDGIDLRVIVFSDYIQPNVQLEEHKLDANFFQNQPALDQFNKEKGTDLLAVAKVYIDPQGIYSGTYKSTTFDDLPDGSRVALPNDPSNEGRALLLLSKAGLITLKDPATLPETPHDIAKNPKNLQFSELEASTLPRVLTTVDLTVINASYAHAVDMDPAKDALFIEGSGSPFVNLLVARPDNRGSSAMQKLVAALHSPEVKQFILEKYQGVFVPVF